MQYSARQSFRVHGSHTERVTGNTEVECAAKLRSSKRRREKLAVGFAQQCAHRGESSTVSGQNQIGFRGALAAITAMSAMLSPFLSDGTALMCKMTPETGARASRVSLPK